MSGATKVNIYFITYILARILILDLESPGYNMDHFWTLSFHMDKFCSTLLEIDNKIEGIC